MIIKPVELFDIIARPDLAATSGSILHVCCGFSLFDNCPLTIGLYEVTAEDLHSRFSRLITNKTTLCFSLKTNAQVMVIGKVLATGEILLHENNLNKAQQPT